MVRAKKLSTDNEGLLSAALEGLELQRLRIESQIAHVRSLLRRRGGRIIAADAAPAKAAKRNLSDAARRRIAAAQKKRWAAYRREKSAK
jgi:hypothetical protein